jgi:hypothetical protein
METPTTSPCTSPLASLATPAKKVIRPFAGFRKLIADFQQPKQDSACKHLPAATSTGNVEALMNEEATSQKFLYVNGRKIPMPKISYK